MKRLPSSDILASNTYKTTINGHQRSKSESIRTDYSHTAQQATPTKLSDELKHLSTELSSFFREEKKQQEKQLQKEQESERKQKFYQEVKSSFRKETERQDRISTLGLTPKASKKVVSSEDKRRHDRLGVSPRQIQKKVLSLSKSKLQCIRDDRIATSARYCPENLIKAPNTAEAEVVPSCPSSPLPNTKTTTTTPSSNSTSEHEPSVHQLELSPVDDIYLTAKICTFMEDYRSVDQNFDLASLLDIPHVAYTNVASNPSQKPIINSILDFGVEDLVLRNFFILDHEDNAKDCFRRMECVIFSSEVKRQFFVCFQGDSDQQKKPIRNREIRTGAAKAKALHPTQPNIKIYPSFHEAYYRNNQIIEEKVFLSIQQLVESNPFFDIVFTGYSFGAALAMIASVRYAHMFSMMRVYCNVFSCPKVGCGTAGVNWRDFVHSLSNLKVQRIEYGSDPFVNLPESSSTWVHGGHSIRISSKENHQPKAYKFDKLRPHPNSIELILRQKIGSTSKKHKHENHEVHCYVHALERFSCRGVSWVKSFVGEDGEGVAGKNNEKRLLV